MKFTSNNYFYAITYINYWIRINYVKLPSRIWEYFNKFIYYFKINVKHSYEGMLRICLAHKKYDGSDYKNYGDITLLFVAYKTGAEALPPSRNRVF